MYEGGAGVNDGECCPGGKAGCELWNGLDGAGWNCPDCRPGLLGSSWIVGGIGLPPLNWGGVAGWPGVDDIATGVVAGGEYAGMASIGSASSRRLKVLNARHDFEEQHTEDAKRVFLNALRQFADLVLRGEFPEE